MQQLKVSFPQPPRIHGLPKLHKPEIPLRPIVDFRNTPTYHLSKFLSTSLIKSSIPNDRSCSNSYQFLRSIRECHVKPSDDMCFVSFDVKSLFTNVPIDLACELIQKHWDAIQENTTLNQDAFIEGIKLCASATVIQYDGKYYRQIFGCPMGSSLSGAITNLVMIDLENTSLQSIPTDAVNIYKRYVDDIFAYMLKCFINTLLTAFNNYHPRLQFTVEYEKEGKLPFLDVSVSKENNALHTTIYVKPTNSQRYLDFKSPSPMTHKYTTARALLARAIYYPSNETEKIKQIKIWSNILLLNNYPNYYIKRIKNIIENSHPPKDLQNIIESPTTNTTNTKLKWIPIPYAPHIHRRLQELMPHDVRLAPIAHDQIRHLYSNAKDTIPEKYKTNVIYALDCKPTDNSKCTATYIGKTSTSLLKRIQGHKSVFNSNPLESSLFAHISSQKSEHCIDFKNPRILDHTKRKHELFIREAWAMNKTENLINNILEISTLPGPFRGLQKLENSQNVVETNNIINENNNVAIQQQIITLVEPTHVYNLRSRQN